MTLQEALHHRRSIRLYQPTPIDPEVVKRCLELSTLAPNSSNMQMWEFHHVTDAAVLKKLSTSPQKPPLKYPSHLYIG